MIERRIAITGGYGFLGWHTACRLRAVHQNDAILLGRDDFSDPNRLAAKLADVDAVIHIAGVNRGDEATVERGNIDLGTDLATALTKTGRPADVVYANSIQADLNNPYGRGKRTAGDHLGAAVRALGGHFADILLPNLFGEHGRPHYNSFVSTFAHEVSAGRQPLVTHDREIGLLHAQDAAESLISAVGTNSRIALAGENARVSEIRDLFVHFRTLYQKNGEIPDLSQRQHRNLFNTFRAALFPGQWPLYPQVNTDDRGALFETVRSHGGTGMSYMSTTRPGKKRGEHYHLHKVERFCVVSGEAEIQLRRLLHSEVLSFRVSGEPPAIIDMPTMWVHNIRNIGTSELFTIFWSDQLLDRSNPDQYPEMIHEEAGQ